MYIFEENTILESEGKKRLKVKKYNYISKKYLVYIEDFYGFGNTVFIFDEEFILKNYTSKQHLRLKKIDRIING